MYIELFEKKWLLYVLYFIIFDYIVLFETTDDGLIWPYIFLDLATVAWNQG